MPGCLQAARCYMLRGVAVMEAVAVAQPPELAGICHERQVAAACNSAATARASWPVKQRLSAGNASR